MFWMGIYPQTFLRKWTLRSPTYIQLGSNPNRRSSFRRRAPAAAKMRDQEKDADADEHFRVLFRSCHRRRRPVCPSARAFLKKRKQKLPGLSFPGRPLRLRCCLREALEQRASLFRRDASRWTISALFLTFLFLIAHRFRHPHRHEVYRSTDMPISASSTDCSSWPSPG